MRVRLRTTLAMSLLCGVLTPTYAAPESARRFAAGAQIAVAWNERAYESAYAEDQFLTFKGQRAHALMHLAQHDALNDIDRRFNRYLAGVSQSASFEPHADPGAAAAQAAHDVLTAQYPNDIRALDALLEQQLNEIAAGDAKEAGRKLGRRSAAAVLAARASDGLDAKGAYTFVNTPGAYQTTPDWKGFVVQPAFGAARPFALVSGNQFRPSPPPALQSSEYAVAFDEVRRFGARHSTTRTQDQTDYAIWWMEFSEGSVNRLARRLVADAKVDLWTATRLFALINVSLMDTYIAVWDSKYHFNHWRPSTAIQDAASDGNPKTAPDPEWESLRPAPPFPEYVSAHAAACASAFRVLEEFFPEASGFSMDSKTAPPGMPTRSFKRFRTAAHECGDSRVRLGFHFRYATDAGERMGREIAQYVIAQRLQRIASKVRSGR